MAHWSKKGLDSVSKQRGLLLRQEVGEVEWSLEHSGEDEDSLLMIKKC